MSAIEQAKNILEALRAELKAEKEGVVTLLKDPRVADWQGIDLKRHHEFLECSGIDPDLIAQALGQYPGKAKAVGQQIAEWGNEIGNQQADLLDRPDPEAALARATALAEKCKRLALLKGELQASVGILLAGAQALRQQLNLHAVLALVKVVAVAKKDFYQEGLAILSLLVPEVGKGEGQSLQELRQEPERLVSRFQHLDVTRLPRLVEEILFHHIEEAVAASRELDTYLRMVEERMGRELDTIASLRQGLSALQDEPPARLLAGLLQQVGVASNLISALYHKRQVKATLATVVEALDCLSILCQLLKSRIVPALQQQVAAPGSTINPAFIAGKMTRAFFGGPQGIIRSFKLMLNSLAGSPAVNEIELQLVLERGIGNCKTFYRKSREDLKKMHGYIDSLVGNYPKPFPHNELFRLTKETLSAYGEVVVKFIDTYDIPKELQRAPYVPAKAGKLIAVIAKQRAMFQKANADAL